jgi:hypothetical protein
MSEQPVEINSGEWAAFFAAGIAVVAEVREYSQNRTWTAFSKVVAAVLAFYAAAMAPSVYAVIGDAIDAALQALFGEVQPYRALPSPT